MKFSTLTLICISILICSNNPKEPIKPASNYPYPTKSILNQSSVQVSSVSYKGKLLEKREWKDINGDNLLMISRYRPPRRNHPDIPSITAESAFLFIDHYVKKGHEYQIIWSMVDSVTNCPVDLWIGPLENSTTITDLDNDSVSEITVIYSHVCRSDVSASNMDLVLTEGNKSYVLQGKMYLDFSGKQLNKETFVPNLQTLKQDKIDYGTEMGRYRDENDFISAPQIFLEYARIQWLEYMDKDKFQQLNGRKD